ncbi:MAG: TolC family protein [Planctomycetota bacterium]
MLTGFFRNKVRRRIALLLAAAAGLNSLSGCSRAFWRQQADKDSYRAIGERLTDPRWAVPRTDLTPDPRSRFFDPYDPDKSPLPPDDAAAHQFMHCVNGIKGYKSWHKLGTAFAIENPQWLETYGIDMQGMDPVKGHAQVQLLKITLPQAMDIACINNRDYQTNIENLYISALALTQQRFALGVRLTNIGRNNGSNSFTYENNERSPLKSSRVLRAGVGVIQTLPSGAQIAMDIANSVTWNLTDKQVTAPTLGYSFTQPLFFNAGRKVVLENLTQAERNVLYNARTLARFRQTLFTEVTASYLNLLQQRQSILNIENNILLLEDQLVAQEARDSRVAGVASGAFDEAAQLNIPESLRKKLRADQGFLVWEGTMSKEEEEAILALSDDPDYLAAAQDLIGFKNQQTTTLSYLQLRDQLNRAQSTLAQSQRQYADQQDNLKLLLGLPPNVVLEVEESALAPFELISRDLLDLERAFRDMQIELGGKLLPARVEGQLIEPIAEFDGLKAYVSQLKSMSDELHEVGLKRVQTDFEEVNLLLQRTQEDPTAYEHDKRYFRSAEERERLVSNTDRNLRIFRFAEQKFGSGKSLLDVMHEVINADSQEAMIQRLDMNANGKIELSELPEGWSHLPRKGNEDARAEYTPEELIQEIASASRILHDENLLRVSQGLEVVQVALRVELIALNPFTLDGTMRVPTIEEVIDLALENRHDLMNARAAVADARRDVEVAANNLEAGVELTFSGEEGLGNSRPSQTASAQFSTPLDRIENRNGYRQALITYQRARRDYMQLEDQIKRVVRQNWRQIQTQEYRVEIDRTTVRNAALQYDSASLQAQAAAQTNALSLVNALNSVLNAQNSLVQDWVTYETNRLNIYRDMGIMQIDPRGVWTDPFYQQMDNLPAGSEESSPAATPDVVLPAPEPQN